MSTYSLSIYIKIYIIQDLPPPTEDVSEELPEEEAREDTEEEEGGEEEEEVGNLADTLAGMLVRCQNYVTSIPTFYYMQVRYSVWQDFGAKEIKQAKPRQMSELKQVISSKKLNLETGRPRTFGCSRTYFTSAVQANTKP
jgi:hypothetical protein